MVLQAYAQKNNIHTRTWQQGIGQVYINLDVMNICVEEDLDIVKSVNEFFHTENLILVDGSKHIRESTMVLTRHPCLSIDCRYRNFKRRVMPLASSNNLKQAVKGYTGRYITADSREWLLTHVLAMLAFAMVQQWAYRPIATAYVTSNKSIKKYPEKI